MPNLTHPPWSQVIPLIPVTDHTVKVKADYWEPIFAEHQLANYFQSIFGGNKSLPLKRAKLLANYPDPIQKCLEIFLWGYPTGGRGNLKHSFFQNVAAVAERAAIESDWAHYYQNLHELEEIGISTITKLAYFFRHSFNGYPAVILDNRIISTLSKGCWAGLTMPQLRYDNAAEHYPEYLKQVAAVAGEIVCTPDQLEFFLFSWGDAFTD